MVRKALLIAPVAAALAGCGVVDVSTTTTPVTAGNTNSPRTAQTAKPATPVAYQEPPQRVEPPDLSAQFSRSDADFAEVGKVDPALKETQEEYVDFCEASLDKLATKAEELPDRQASKAVSTARLHIEQECQTARRRLASQIQKAEKIESGEATVSSLKEAYQVAMESEKKYKDVMNTLDKTGPYLSDVEERSEKLRQDAIQELSRRGVRGKT